MSDLPAGWCWANGSDVFELVRGVSYKKHDARNEPAQGLIPILRATNIQNGKITTDELLYVPEHYVSERQILQKGDVLIATSSGSRSVVGKAAFVQNTDDRLSFGAFCGVARHNMAADGAWLFSYTRNSSYREYVERVALGTNINNFRASDINAMPIPLPPVPEQKRIVAKLDSLTARSEHARVELDRIPRLVARYKQAVLAAAFCGNLTADWRAQNRGLQSARSLIEATPEPAQPRGGREATDSVIEGRAAISVNVPPRPAPEGWAWVNLRRLARQETGHTPSRQHPEYWSGDIPWIGIKDAGNHHGGVIEDTIQHVSQAGLDNSSARLLPARTVCLSRTASVGYVVMMGREMATSQDFVTWTCSEALDPEYLMYALLAEAEDIRRFGKGTTHTTIYYPEVRALHICLAPIAEQREIVRFVKAAITWVDKIAQEHTAAFRLLDRLDQSILAKAFRGDLVPQDPSDEPASVLLEKIRQERESRPKRQKATKRRVTRMAKLTKESVAEAIHALPNSEFEFEELRARVSGDYDSLKDILFSMLSEKRPVIRQSFYTDTQTMKFVRVDG